MSVFTEPLIRFTPDNVCPLCGGWPDLPQHQGRRCRGAIRGDIVWCQQTVSSKEAPLECYVHWVGAGECRYCGQNHGGVTRTLYISPQPMARNNEEQRVKGEWALKDAVRTIDFLIKDESGMQVMIHRRFEFPDNTKTYRYLRSRREWGTGGVSPRDLPLFGAEDLAGYDKSKPLFVTEGEPARGALITHGYQAVAVHSGASNCPSPAVWLSVKGFAVALWPDADLNGQGEGLMRKASTHLQRQGGTDVWALDVERFKAVKDGFDAANWDKYMGDESLDAFLNSAERVKAAPAEAEAAVAVAGEIVSARRSRRKGLRDRLDERLEDTKMPWLIKRAERIAACQDRWVPLLCADCKSRPASPESCHDNLCALCAAGRFFHDWHVRVNDDPEIRYERFRLLVYTPDEPVTGPAALKLLRNRFTESRKRIRLQGGIIGNRCSYVHGGLILAALPRGILPPERIGTFNVTVAAEDAGEREVASWLWSEYEAEIAEAVEAPETYFLDWLAAVKGRKRFSAFGSLYRTPTCSPIDDSTVTGGMPEVERISLKRFQGGSGNAGTREKRKCPFCGSTRLTSYAMRLTAERITYERGHAEWIPALE